MRQLPSPSRRARTDAPSALESRRLAAGEVRRAGRRARLSRYAGLLPLALVVAICLLAPLLPAADAAASLGARPLASPSLAHPVGTDQLGRDLLARVLLGTRTSVTATAAAVAATSLLGATIGLIAGYSRRGGPALVALTNVFLAFPGMVAAMALAALAGGGLRAAVLALAVTAWPKYARLVRAQVLAVRETAYVRSSQLMGTPHWRVLTWHVLPQVVPLVLVTASLDAGTLMVELAGLSFLGLGAQPPTPELGLMLSQSRSMLLSHPWVVAAPAVAMCAVVAACHLAADALREQAAQPLSAAGWAR